MFFGHNHWDEFQLFFDRTEPDKLRPYAVAYVSPSITPYEKPNPAYRIYYLDGEHPDTTYVSTPCRAAGPCLLPQPIWIVLSSAPRVAVLNAGLSSRPLALAKQNVLCPLFGRMGAEGLRVPGL